MSYNIPYPSRIISENIKTDDNNEKGYLWNKMENRNRLVKIFASKNLKTVHPRAEIKMVISKK